MNDWFSDRSRIEKLIAGAIASAVDAHGPITRANRASAAKRVYAALAAARRVYFRDLKPNVDLL